MMKILLSFLLCVNVVYAQEQMVIVEKGKAAPFKGILSNAEQMKKFRESHEQFKLCEEKSQKQSDINRLQSLENKFYKAKYEDIYKTHERYKAKNWWQKTGYFLLGVIITGTISYGAMKYSRR